VASVSGSAKSVLITGCSSGIGRCVAAGLRARGHRVLATARRSEDVLALKREGYESWCLDLASSESIQTAVDAVLEYTEGTLDALFNNGAYGQSGALEDLSRAALREQFETNVFGWHELSARVVPVMRRQGQGRIIQNSSVLGLVALKYRGAYNASKFALEGLSDTLRAELRGSGVHVSLIEPGPISTRFRANAYAAFKRHIDVRDSAHSEAYVGLDQRLRATGAVVPFTLPPEAMLRPVRHALESRRPKVRYYVTVPTYLFATLRRILPYRTLDWVLSKVG